MGEMDFFFGNDSLDYRPKSALVILLTQRQSTQNVLGISLESAVLKRTIDSKRQPRDDYQPPLLIDITIHNYLLGDSRWPQTHV